MVETYLVGMLLAGAVVFAAAYFHDWFANRPISPAMAYVTLGAIAFTLPLGLPPPNPIEYATATERLAEFVVIVALMGVGLKIDRPPSLSGWASTWRLLAITMPVTIGIAALLGWWVIGLAPATALLLGAVLAPTDPVLAADVQVDEPARDPDEVGKRAEPEVRFALTSEAGLNDGLAFPFTYAAVAVASVGLAPAAWVGEWLLVDVLYRIGVGVAAGMVSGWLAARIVFRFSPRTTVGKAVSGIEALAITLLVYGLTEMLGGYGFIAVFVAALALRRYELTHEYNRALHGFSELVERLALAVVLVLFGGALATGLLDALTIEGAIAGVAIVLLIRPLAGMFGFLGSAVERTERGVVSFFGIRGIASIFYLAYALNQATFPNASQVWSVVGFVIVLSIFLHGVTAPLVSRLDLDPP